MIKEEFERDLNCMTKNPEKNKCQIECLLDYRFDNMNFTSVDFCIESDLLLLGNNKGQILAYFLRVQIDQSYNCTVDSVRVTQVFEKNLNP